MLYWGGSCPPPALLRRLRHPGVRVQHFAHCTELTHKHRMAINVERQRRRRRRATASTTTSAPLLFPSIPESFVLPHQLADWIDEHRRRGGKVHPELQTAIVTLVAPRAKRRSEGEDEEGEATEGDDGLGGCEDAECAAFYASHSGCEAEESGGGADGEGGGCAAVWILKPPQRGSGRGIIVTDLFSSPPCPLLLRALYSPYVVQRYIERPLLVRGHKMDVRLYVALLSSVFPHPTALPCPFTSLRFPDFPFRVFVYNDGLVRLASMPYPTSPLSCPTAADTLTNPFVHLTNNDINRQRSAEHGQQQNLSFHHFTSHHLQPSEAASLMRSIDLCVLSALSSSPSFLRSGRCPSQSSHFALLGLDLLLDESCHPWLCEVNHQPDLTSSPSPFAAPYAVDAHVKLNLIADLLTLIQLPREEEGSPAPLTPAMDERQPDRHLAASEYHIGGFRRLV